MRGHRWYITSYLGGLMALLCVTTASWSAQVRVPTYNIRFLSTEVVNQGDRLSKLREVIEALDAHVIGLQEIADRAGNRFALSGVVPAQQLLTLTMQAYSMPLNNSGDDVSLIDPQGHVRDHVSYSAAQAASGQVVTFEQP